jgi:hypothetical protein
MTWIFLYIFKSTDMFDRSHRTVIKKEANTKKQNSVQKAQGNNAKVLRAYKDYFAPT